MSTHKTDRSTYGANIVPRSERNAEGIFVQIETAKEAHSRVYPDLAGDIGSLYQFRPATPRDESHILSAGKIVTLPDEHVSPAHIPVQESPWFHEVERADAPAVEAQHVVRTAPCQVVGSGDAETLSTSRWSFDKETKWSEEVEFFNEERVDTGFRFRPTPEQIAATQLRNEESERKRADHNEWRDSMRAAGRPLPSDSGNALETMHRDDTFNISPSSAVQAAVRERHTNNEWGSFDERAVCLSKVYIGWKQKQRNDASAVLWNQGELAA
jgi:hypothetical protein